MKQWKETGEVPEGYYIDENKRLRKVGKEPPKRIEDVEFDRLKAMKHVLGNPASTDETAGERACREWLGKNPGQFMEVFDRLEAEAKKQVAGEKVQEEEALEPTQSDEELTELVNELLTKHAERARK